MQRVITSFLIAFILLLVVIILSRFAYNDSKNFSDEAERSRVVIDLYNTLDLQLRSAEIYSPTYDNTPARDLYQLYKNDLFSIESTLKQLKFRTKADKEQAAIVDTLELLISKHLPLLRQRNMAEIITVDGVGPLLDFEQSHRLIKKGLKDEVGQLNAKKNNVIDATQRNNILTIALAVLAIGIVTYTFFQQVFLSKKSLWLEGFLESILNTTQNGIVYYRAVRENEKIVDFKIEYANEIIHELLGADPKKVIGKRLGEANSFAQNQEVFSSYIKVVETGAPVQFEYHYHHHNLDRWLYLSIAKLGDGITVSFQNIGELKGYEDDLKKNIYALEQSNRELEEYAYAASHDLQEPLRKIRTFGSILYEKQKANLDEKSRDHLEKIIQSTERMSMLIKDLLSFSELKEKNEFVTTDLNVIFENVLKDMEVTIAQKKAVITHDPLPEINAIPVQINQLFYNLVNNALKFSKKELPLHLDVSCKVVNSNDVKDVPGLQPATPYYEIIFSDNGIGFSQEYAIQIFGLFKRLNDKSSYAGSGIGLSLCKKVVNNHGGVIAANGKEGIGAQFYIYLPVVKPKAEVDGAAMGEL